jgi:hypothetical protein
MIYITSSSRNCSSRSLNDLISTSCSIGKTACCCSWPCVGVETKLSANGESDIPC